MDDVSDSQRDLGFHQSASASLRQTIIRVWRYLTRRKALVALLLIAIAIAIVLATGTSSAIGQVGLVAIAVLVTSIFLPETPHRLWNVDAHALAETVPAAKLVHASRELAGAIALQTQGPIPEHAVRMIWDSGLKDIASVLENPAKLVFDLEYRVQVTPDEFEGTLVSTSIGAKRCLPNAQESVWFSFCSSIEGLDQEFALQGQGCIGRELVDLRGGETLLEWEERVRSYQVELLIDGKPATALPEIVKRNEPDHWSVVRLCYAPGAMKERYVPSELTIEFRSNARTAIFPFKFNSYYSVGASQFTFEIMDPSALISVDEYLSASSRDVLVERPPAGLRSSCVKIRAAEGTVLPPGVEAVFSWGLRTQLPLETPPTVLASLVGKGAALPEPLSLPIAPPPCEDIDEPLVPITQVPTLDAYARLGILPPRTLQVRAEVADRIHRVHTSLPDDFGLLVLDGWRSLDEQRALIDYYGRYGVTQHYVASVDQDSMRPPHATGGALDVTLTWKGIPLALGTGYDNFTHAAHFRAFEATDGVVRRLRRLLASAMLAEEFAPYEYEWWHWSYGDDIWSYEQGRPARYNVVKGAT